MDLAQLLQERVLGGLQERRPNRMHQALLNLGILERLRMGGLDLLDATDQEVLTDHHGLRQPCAGLQRGVEEDRVEARKLLVVAPLKRGGNHRSELGQLHHAERELLECLLRRCHLREEHPLHAATLRHGECLEIGLVGRPENLLVGRHALVRHAALELGAERGGGDLFENRESNARVVSEAVSDRLLGQHLGDHQGLEQRETPLVATKPKLGVRAQLRPDPREILGTEHDVPHDGELALGDADVRITRSGAERETEQPARHVASLSQTRGSAKHAPPAISCETRHRVKSTEKRRHTAACVLVVGLVFGALALAPRGALAFAPRGAQAGSEPPGMSLWRQLVLFVRQLVSTPPVESQRTTTDWVRLAAWEALAHGSARPSLHTSLRRHFALQLADATRTQSVGRPQCGHLARPVELPEHPAYLRRHPDLAWGTKATVVHVGRAIERVRSSMPWVHPLAVGDISAEHGGPLLAHRSHQSGRDVDLGLYYLDPPPSVPHRFVRATAENLDRAATWALLTALAHTSTRPGGVDFILLDHDVQRMLFEWAQKEGVPARKIGRILQYPRPPDAPVGLVRHFPKHADHMHVRFRCPPDDRWCIS
jgi:murein endopeptidase